MLAVRQPAAGASPVMPSDAPQGFVLHLASAAIKCYCLGQRKEHKRGELVRPAESGLQVQTRNLIWIMPT